MLLYIAKIFTCLDKKVLVIDLSAEGKLRYNIPYSKNLMTDNFISHQNIDFLLDQYGLDANENYKDSDYDVVIMDYGYNKEIVNDDPGLIYLVTDIERYSVEKLMSLVEKLKGKNEFVKIYRNLIDCKINEKYVDNLLKLPEESKVIAGYVFHLTDSDYKCTILSQHENSFKFKDVSKGYKKMFADIVEETFDIDAKVVGKAILKAEKGR